MGVLPQHLGTCSFDAQKRKWAQLSYGYPLGACSHDWTNLKIHYRDKGKKIKTSVMQQCLLWFQELGVLGVFTCWSLFLGENLDKRVFHS